MTSDVRDVSHAPAYKSELEIYHWRAQLAKNRGKRPDISVTSARASTVDKERVKAIREVVEQWEEARRQNAFLPQ